ncbi:MAG TPA: BTAD domain-containing putative transcriptional regulator [Acidimicrobiia bacterium]|nr:BTAD domain-containing putative transcriptional regulator [Acidimicrobiia bacterium]
MVTAQSPPASLLSRPRLEGLVSQVQNSRVTVVSAGAGFGKSVLLDAWAERLRSAQLSLTPADRTLASMSRRLIDTMRLRVPAIGSRPDLAGGISPAASPLDRAAALAGFVAASLEPHLSRPLVLMIDDVQEVEDSESAAFLEALVRHAPARLAIVLSGRGEPPVRLARMRARGEVVDLDSADLAFTLEETTDLALTLLGPGQTLNAQIVHSATAGWPAATRMALEALRDGSSARASDLLARAPSPGNLLFDYLAEEVLAGIPESERQLLAQLTQLDVFTPELVESLELSGREALASLIRQGIFIEQRDGELAVRSLLGDFLAAQLAFEPEKAIDLHRRAAAWYRQRHEPIRALRHATRAVDEDLLVEVLEGISERALSGGGAAAVLAACRQLPSTARRGVIGRLYGEAQLATGDWEGALATFRQVSGEQSPVDPGLAWRMGLGLHLRGELTAALAAYEQGDLESGSLTDRALLLGWRAGALWLTGDLEQSRQLAQQAEEWAAEAGSDRALATALTVKAMLAASDGDRRANELLYLRALEHATAAGDVLQLIRIHVNRGSRHLEEGNYEEAIAETELALPLADLAGYTTLRALGVNNRGQARMHLGRFEEAVTDFREAATLWQQLSARQVAYSMSATGDIHRLRGDLHLARLSYEEALRVAEPVGDAQALVPAWAGLARVLASEDPKAAGHLVEKALAVGPVLGRAQALLAAAEVQMGRGARSRVEEAAATALAFARERRDRAAMADALELTALVSDQPEGPLNEAIAIWTELGNPLGQARAELRLARHTGGTEQQLLELVATLRRMGARRLAEEATGLLDDLRQRSRPRVSIGALGGFRVTVEGEPVAATAWQSKKAREILRVLVARRGTPIHREMLMELLWPEEDPKRTANRLSVALSVIRGVLDPGKAYPADYYLEADRDSVGLHLPHLAIDLEVFHSTVNAGFSAARTGNPARAAALLEEAEALYLGDLFEDEPYEDWAQAAREEARAAYISVARWLAETSREQGDLDAAIRYLLRLLQRDPYDESAHLALVTVTMEARRHGEARRLYRQYCARMEELGVEASPYPMAQPA